MSEEIEEVEENSQNTGAVTVPNDNHDYTTSYKDFSEIDFDSSIDLIRSWNQMISSVTNQIPKLANDSHFKALQDVSLENGFSSSFDSKVEKIFSDLGNLDNSMLNSINELLAVDEENEDDLPGGKGGGRSTSNNPSVSLIENSKEQLEAYQKISLENLNEIASELVKLADKNNKTLEDLLNDKTYDKEIQALLLNSQHIPEDLKKLIYDGEIDISRKLLANIFSGKEPSVLGVDETTCLTMKQCLTDMATSKGLTLQGLVENDANIPFVRSVFSNFEDVTSCIMKQKNNDNIVDELLNIYDGNEIADMKTSTVDIIRKQINNVATTTNSTIENAVSSSSTVDQIKQIGRFGVFVNHLNGYSASSVSSILQSLMK